VLIHPLRVSPMYLFNHDYYSHLLTPYPLYTLHHAVRKLPPVPTADTIRNEDHHCILGRILPGSITAFDVCGSKHEWWDPKCQSTLVGHGTGDELLVPLGIVDSGMGRVVCHWRKSSLGVGMGVPVMLSRHQSPPILINSSSSRQSHYHWQVGTWKECGDGRNLSDSALLSLSDRM
jgi:hypothetical protein